MSALFGTDARASAVRALFRAAIVLGTAFGLDLTADQVAAVQVFVEALIQAGRAWKSKSLA